MLDYGSVSVLKCRGQKNRASGVKTSLVIEGFKADKIDNHSGVPKS